MSIKQFNGEWVAQEDRILFRFNTTEGQEYRLWLTRHIVKNLIVGSQSLAVKAIEKQHPPEVAQAIQAFQQQSVSQQLNFAATFEGQTELPMGEAPALVTGLRITMQSPEVVIDFETTIGQVLHLQINDELLKAMIGLLERLQGLAQWGLGATAGEPPVTSATGPSSTLMH
jgi:hypothetical protein